MIVVDGTRLLAPEYSFPDLIAPWADEMEEHIAHWLDTDFAFLSGEARRRYRAMKLGHAAARVYGAVRDRDRLIPCTRLVVVATILDDYYELCDVGQLAAPLQRTIEVLSGQSRPGRADNGIMHGLATLREELLAFTGPDWMARFVQSWLGFVAGGVAAEAPYKQSRRYPSVRNLLDIRTLSLGIVPCTDLFDITTGWAPPPAVAHHPAIAILRWLTSRVMAIQNDLYSLPKEVARDSEVVNLVLALQRERGVTLPEAYRLGLAIHDATLAELVRRLSDLPDFGADQERVCRYVGNFGIMIQGCRSWYEKDTHRYLAGAAGYAPGEYR